MSELASDSSTRRFAQRRPCVSEGAMSGSNTMRDFQESGHGRDHDYTRGSPHLQHAELNAWVEATLLDAIRSATPEGGSAHVLEVGAGHGVFTEHLVGAGASVVVTEMSAPSVEVLRHRFAGVDRVCVVHDPTGDVPVEGTFDAVVYVSVLHHIPDYVSAVTRIAERIRPGGVFVSMQDPMLFARQSRFTRIAARGMYLGWRITQGDLRRGVATTARRLRRVYDETEPSDMVEYHAVRGGVDEQALATALEQRFADVRILPYWSSQAGWAQRVGRRFCKPNTFGLVATGRLPSRAR